MRRAINGSAKYLKEKEEVVQLPLLRSTIEAHATGV